MKPPPIPDNTDKRGSDLIADQSSRRASKDPNTFTFNGPEPDTDPFESSSPPEFPTLSGFDNAGLTLDLGSVKLESYIQDAVSSQLKKVSINGFTPEISGSGLSYNLPISPKASELFSILNPSPSKFMPAEGVSVAASGFFAPEPSLAPRAPFNSSITPASDLQVASVSNLGRNQFSKFSLPSSLSVNVKSSSTYSSDSPIQPSSRSELTSQHPNSSLVKDLANSSPQDQLKYFNSRRRLEGESKEDFRERKKEIRELRKSGDLDHIIDAIKNGDSSYFYKSFIPVYVTRADGQKKILIRLDNSHSTVIEGAGTGERSGSLPPDDSYYVASGGSSTQYPWDIIAYPDPNSTAQNPPYKAKIVPGTIGGILPSNYDIELSVGTGLKYGVVDCTTNGEAVTSATISFSSSFPNPPSATADKAPTSFKVCFGMVDKQNDEAPKAYNFWKRSPGAVPNAAYAIAPTTSGQATKYYYVWRVG